MSPDEPEPLGMRSADDRRLRAGDVRYDRCGRKHAPEFARQTVHQVEAGERRSREDHQVRSVQRARGIVGCLLEHAIRNRAPWAVSPRTPGHHRRIRQRPARCRGERPGDGAADQAKTQECHSHEGIIEAARRER